MLGKKIKAKMDKRRGTSMEKSEELKKGDLISLGSKIKAKMQAKKAAPSIDASTARRLSPEEQQANRKKYQEEGNQRASYEIAPERRQAFSSQESKADRMAAQVERTKRLQDQTDHKERLVSLVAEHHGPAAAAAANHVFEANADNRSLDLKQRDSSKNERIAGKATSHVAHYGQTPEGHHVFVHQNAGRAHLMVAPSDGSPIQHLGRVRSAAAATEYHDPKYYDSPEAAQAHQADSHETYKESVQDVKGNALREKELRSTKVFSEAVPSMGKHKDAGEFNKKDYVIQRGPYVWGMEIRKKGSDRDGFQYDAKKKEVPADHAEYNALVANRSKLINKNEELRDASRNHSSLSPEHDEIENQRTANKVEINKHFDKINAIENAQPTVISPAGTKNREHHDQAMRFFQQHMQGHSKVKNAYGDFSLEPAQNPSWASDQEPEAPAKPKQPFMRPTAGKPSAPKKPNPFSVVKSIMKKSQKFAQILKKGDFVGNNPKNKDRLAVTKDGLSSSPAAVGEYAHPFQFTQHDTLTKEQVPAKTTSGKPMMSHFDHPDHKDYSAQDHKDAAAAHQNHIREIKPNNPNENLIKFHEDQYRSHWSAFQTQKPTLGGSLKQKYLKKSISAQAIELGQYKDEDLQPAHHTRIANEYRVLAKKAHHLGDNESAKRFFDKAEKHQKQAEPSLEKADQGTTKQTERPSWLSRYKAKRYGSEKV